jgi:hypothetical protein
MMKGVEESCNRHLHRMMFGNWTVSNLFFVAAVYQHIRMPVQKIPGDASL